MKTEGVRKLWDRYKYAALILLVGAGLLLWPAGSGATAQTGQNEASQVYAAAENLQAEMEEILGQIQGVGTVQVLLTAAGCFDLKSQSPISDIGISSTFDMTSRKRPVPAAHLSFIANCMTKP